MRTHLLNKTFPTGSLNYNQIVQTWKEETQKPFIRIIALQIVFCFVLFCFLISEPTDSDLAWQVCIALSYP